MKQCMERLYNGLIKENPTFVLMLGMCPTLAVTTSAINGLGMGLSTMVVLALSNLLISAMRKMIPDKVRIPAYIVIIATFVTLVELLLHAYVPALHESLGIYISLIVVNCIILGRAESYASKNKMLPSLFDGIGMGLGFTLALTLIGLVRELLGAGTVFGISGPDLYGTSLPELLVGLVNKWLDPNSTSEAVQFWNRLLTDEISSFSPMGIMVMAPGAFFILAILTAIQNVVKEKGRKEGKDVSKIQSGCSSDCMNCKDSGCAKRLVDEEAVEVLESDEVKEIEEVKEEVREEIKEEIKEVQVIEGNNIDATKVIEKDKVEAKTVKEIKTEVVKETKQKMTLLEATQEIDIVELEDLLEEMEEEGNTDE